MKKIVLFFLSLVIILAVYSQPVTPSCSLDDYALYQHHPSQIDDFQAVDLIVGRKDKVAVQGPGYFSSYSQEKGFLLVVKLKRLKKKKFIFLSKLNTEGKREYVTSRPYFFYSHTQENWHFWAMLITFSFMAFLFLLPIINSFGSGKWPNKIYNKWSENWQIKKKIMRVEFITLPILGSIAYGVYIAILSGQLLPNEKVKFHFIEPLVMILGVITSGFLYLGILTIIYETEKLLKKHRLQLS